MKFYRYVILMAILSTLGLNAKILRLETDQLVNNTQAYTLLDTRTKNDYEKSHIENSLNFPISLTYEHQKINGKIVQPKKIQNIIRNLGLKKEDNIVIYDDGTFFDASRLFWTLEVYGFENVKLLNGGFTQWQQQNYKVTKVIPKVIPSNYIVTVNNKRLATKFTTQLATRNPNQVILDARGIAAYNGEESVSKRFGHIPKAIHFPATHNINYKKDIVSLKTTANLKEIYSDIKKENKIVVYCAIGRIAATNYFALRELGYDVANYDASWQEWGDDLSLPINNPSKE